VSKLEKSTAFVFFILCILFIIVPIGYLFIGVSIKDIIVSLKERDIINALFISFFSATCATLFGIVLGVPAGYFIARYKFRGRSLIESITNLPIVVPHVAVGIIFLNLLSKGQPLGRLFAFWGITFIDTLYGIAVVMSFVSISYIITSSIVGFRSVNTELELTARTLGASTLFTLKKITLPLVLPYILRGAILAFARALSEVGAVLIIAYYPKTAPILLYEKFENYGFNSAKPIAVIIILLSLILFILFLYVSSRIVRVKDDT